MNTHTPGPWAAASRQGDDWDSVVCIPGTPNEICQCFHGRGNEDECEANARLIAAAPEMLEALNHITDEMELADFDPDDTDTWYGRALAIIAKAEGRA